MSINSEIKFYCKNVNKTLAFVASKIGLSKHSLYSKLKNSTIKYEEVKDIALSLGYRIKWVTKDTEYDSHIWDDENPEVRPLYSSSGNLEVTEEIIHLGKKCYLSFLFHRKFTINKTVVYSECANTKLTYGDNEAWINSDKIIINERHIIVMKDSIKVFETYNDLLVI